MVPAHELRVPIDPVQGARHDVLLRRVDRPGEGFHPISHPIRLHARPRRRPPRGLHHFVDDPAKKEGIGPREGFGRVTMQLFVRGDCTMIAAPVQCDVDGISKGPHYVLLKRDNAGAEPPPTYFEFKRPPHWRSAPATCSASALAQKSTHP